jgi:hypothetical protein
MINNPTQIPQISERLIILLKLARNSIHKDEDWSWQLVAKALAQTYAPNMHIYQVLSHCTEALYEISTEPLFRSYRSEDLYKLLVSPIYGVHRINLRPSPKNKYTAEQWINTQVLYILERLSITSVGWCRDQLDAYTYVEYQSKGD